MFGYHRFVWRNRRLLGFGALIAASSSFGQTWFVSLFSGHIRSEYGLTHGDFGAIYSGATLLSGVLIIWVGRQIDRVSLRLYTTLAFAGIIVGCSLVAGTRTMLFLGASIFALRMAGQGVMSHISATTMARLFDANRGKALSVAAMGYPLAESVLPTVVVATVAWLGWRGAWLGAATVLTFVLLPNALWLIGSARTGEPRIISPGTGSPTRGPRRLDWTRSDVLRDRRFYLVLPALLAAPIISTGIMFHQVHLVAEKRWTLSWLAVCYVGYAITKVLGTLVAGPLVDRFTAVRLFPTYLPPLAVGLFVLGASDSPLVALVLFSLSGLTTGLGGPIGGAYWAERYGLAHIGAIRAMAVSVMVLGSALSPAGYGWLIDAGVTMDTIALASAVYIVGAVALAAIASWRTDYNPA